MEEERDRIEVYGLLGMFDGYESDDSEEDYEEDFDSLTSVDKYVDSDREITDEEQAIYQAQVKETDGFDVKSIPGVSEFGQIIPMKLSSKLQMEESVFYTKMAIDKFNKRLKDTEGELVLDKVLMAMCKAVNGLRYYLTFDAKNLGKGGEIITYQAVVLNGSGRKDKVQSFRLKPSGSKKEWFWVSHLCGCESESDSEDDV